MRAAIAVLLLAAALGGCVTTKPPIAAACGMGQERLRTAQLFFGRNAAGKPAVSEVQFRKFVDEEVTPRFPDGMTVMDGGGHWRGEENKLIREAAKVVLIVLPKGRDADSRVEAVRNAYREWFHQDSVMLITQASCVSL